MRFGKVKTYAHRMLNGEAIPIFNDNKDNRAIDKHAARIRKAQTKRTKSPPSVNDF